MTRPPRVFVMMGFAVLACGGAPRVRRANLNVATAGPEQAAPSGGCEPVEDVVLPSPAGPWGEPHLAWNGSGWALVWSESDPQHPNLYFALLDARGRVVEDSRRALFLRDGLSRVGPRIVWDGRGYGLIYRQCPGNACHSRFARIDAFGAVSGDVPLGFPTLLTGCMAVAWSPVRREFGVMCSYRYLDRSPPAHVDFVRIDANGTARGPVLHLDDDDAPPGWHVARSLVWNGSAFATAWADGGAVHIAEIGADGPTNVIVVPAPGGARSDGGVGLHANGRTYGFAWCSGSSGYEGFIRAGRVPRGRSARPTSASVLGSSPTAYDSRPAVWVDDAGTVYVVWTEPVGLALGRFPAAAPDGKSPTHEPLTTSEGQHHFPEFVTAGGCGFAVVYREMSSPGRIRMIRFETAATR